MINNLIQIITTNLLSWAESVPVSLFAFVGSLIEELIPIIPSSVVMITAGLMAQVQGDRWWWLLIFALLASVGKTLGSWVFYFIADKAEDLATGRWGKVLGLSHQEIEHAGKVLSERKLDTIFLFTTRIIPVLPTTIFSVACGLIKLDLKIYLKVTLVGFFIRSLIVLVIGYLGVTGSHWLVAMFDQTESVALVIIIVLGAGLLGYLYWRKKRGLKVN